jgi:hypothetical protein
MDEFSFNDCVKRIGKKRSEKREYVSYSPIAALSKNTHPWTQQEDKPSIAPTIKCFWYK